MSLETALQLGILALIDSTSIGTLVIPLWLLLHRNTDAMGGKVIAYLGVLGTFYFGVGIALLLGATALWESMSSGAESLGDLPAVRWAATALGVGLIIWGFTTSKNKRAASPDARWGTRIDTALASPAGLVSLALVAGALELPTMLPYLAAVGILTNASIAVVPSIGVLALYCLIMLTPALALTAARLGFKNTLDPLLTALSQKLSAWTKDAAKWIAAIVGILVLRWAAFSAGSPLLEILQQWEGQR